MEEEIYTFKIGAYSPDTIPMARLAEYMLAMADVYGERASVHFKTLKKGSTILVSRVAHEAAPKVRENVNAAQWGEGSSQSVTAYKKVNGMLRADNATGELRRGRARVLVFPGRDLVTPARLGPFNQATTKEGVLVRIGGKDSTAHAMLEDTEKNVWSFEVTRELAVQLAHHLFQKPIRLIGHGRVVRNEHGVWEYLALKATEFETLSTHSLIEEVSNLRGATRDVPEVSPDALRRRFRDESQAH